jgi:predicted anti-sigma-YlaC factor YlaD
MHPMPEQCERARAWASLRADGELSELESALLDGHLGRCTACRTFAQGAEDVAATLRSVQFESVRLESVAAPALLPSARARRRGLLRAGRLAAAAVAVVATAVVAASASGPSGDGEAAKPVSMVAGVDSPDGLRELRRPALVEKSRSLPRNRFVPGVAV